MESISSLHTATGFGAFVRALAAAPELDHELTQRYRRLEGGGVVIADTYEIGALLGRGGVGTVYRAHDRELDRPVAVKFLRLETLALAVREEVVRLLEREALATASLNHPNIITLHRYGTWEGLPYMVLELLTGEPLAARMARGALGPADALRITEQILAGLEHAHAHGVLHRDLAPGNVFVRDDGVVKILDFGLSSLRAATTAASGRPGVTLLGAGTPGYMSPEQRRGDTPDARSDLWATGTLLANMLASGPRPARALRRYLTRARAESPVARFADASVMRAALPGLRSRRLGPRRVLALVAALVAVVAVAGFALRGGRATRAAVDPLSFMKTRAASAQPVEPEQAWDLEGLWRSQGTTTGGLVSRRSPHGYHFESRNGDGFVGEARLWRVDGVLYLVGDLRARKHGYLFEWRIEGPAAATSTLYGWWDAAGDALKAWSFGPETYERHPLGAEQTP